MNKMIATAALGFLTMGTLSAGLSSKVEAFASRSVAPIQNASPAPRAIEKTSELNQKSQELAYATYCETQWVDGRAVSCCVDSAGNWACVW